MIRFGASVSISSIIKTSKVFPNTIHFDFQIGSLLANIWGWGQGTGDRGQGRNQDARVCPEEAHASLSACLCSDGRTSARARAELPQESTGLTIPAGRETLGGFCLYPSELQVTGQHVSFLSPNRNPWSNLTLSAASLSWWPQLSPLWTEGKGPSSTCRRGCKEGSLCPIRTWVWNLQIVPNTLKYVSGVGLAGLVWFGFFLNYLTHWFVKTASSYHFHAMKLTCFRCTVQWVLMGNEYILTELYNRHNPVLEP